MSFEPLIMPTVRAAGALSLTELQARLGSAFDSLGLAQLVKQGALRVQSVEPSSVALPPTPTKQEPLSAIADYFETVTAEGIGEAVELSTGPAGWRGF